MASPSTKAAAGGLMKKLAEVAKGIDAIEAAGVNPRFQYKFVEEAAVVAAIRGALYENGVFLTTKVDKVETAPFGEKMLRTQLSLTFTFYDVEGGESLEIDWFAEAMDNGDKGIAKAVTSGLKYFLLKNFLIPKGGDDPEADGTTDGAGESHAAGKPTSPAPAAPRQSAPAAGQKREFNESPDRKKYRECLYTAMREAKLETDVKTIKEFVAQATGKTVGSLFEVDAEMFRGTAMFVYDNVLEMPYPDALRTDLDSDIPF